MERFCATTCVDALKNLSYVKYFCYCFFAVFNVAFLYQLYQMYGRRTPEDVFDIMTKYSVSYIILEDSHCLAPSRSGCRLPDLIDVDNGIVCFYFNYCSCNCRDVLVIMV